MTRQLDASFGYHCQNNHLSYITYGHDLKIAAKEKNGNKDVIGEITDTSSSKDWTSSVMIPAISTLTLVLRPILLIPTPSRWLSPSRPLPLRSTAEDEKMSSGSPAAFVTRHATTRSSAPTRHQQNRSIIPLSTTRRVELPRPTGSRLPLPPKSVHDHMTSSFQMSRPKTTLEIQHSSISPHANRLDSRRDRPAFHALCPGHGDTSERHFNSAHHHATRSSVKTPLCSDLKSKHWDTTC
jgi:hypothetical protein